MSGAFSTYLQYKDFTAFATQILCVDLGTSSRFCKQILKLGGSPGLVILGGDTCSEGRGFEF